jgi:hypothetical protein
MAAQPNPIPRRRDVLPAEARNDARRICGMAWEASPSDFPHFNHLFESCFGDTPSPGAASARKAGPAVSIKLAPATSKARRNRIAVVSYPMQIGDVRYKSAATASR